MKTYFFTQVYDKEKPDEKLKATKIWERYLEVIIEHRGIEEERFHTQLALSYIENLFRLFPKETSYSAVDKEKNSEQRLYSNKLNKFLEREKSKYNSSTLLEKIKDSWLLQHEITLYKRDKKHEEAIKVLLNTGNYEAAENYCLDSQDKLLTKLVQSYLKLYKEVASKLQASEPRAELGGESQ